MQQKEHFAACAKNMFTELKLEISSLKQYLCYTFVNFTFKASYLD